MAIQFVSLQFKDEMCTTLTGELYNEQSSNDIMSIESAYIASHLLTIVMCALFVTISGISKVERCIFSTFYFGMDQDKKIMHQLTTYVRYCIQ